MEGAVTILKVVLLSAAIQSGWDGLYNERDSTARRPIGSFANRNKREGSLDRFAALN